MKLLGLLCILFLFTHTKSYASHAAGGELYVVWVAPNTYDIYLRAFRDCNSSFQLETDADVGLYIKGTNFQEDIFSLQRISNDTDIDLGDSCYTPTGLCIDEALYKLSGVYIPDNANGYYLEHHINARNAAVSNLTSPSSKNFVFYCEIPDPALGANSSPNFGTYPLDSYMCINNSKTWSFPVFDADGDSLAYSFVNPLGNTGGTGTSAGTGAYPYYPSVAWAGGYSLANICGGTIPMSIDPITGEITAMPSIASVFAYSVRVEEYRNGVKIGEVRRDVQYASLNCTVDTPPVINVDDTVSVYYGDSICVDMTISDGDGTDTIYVTPTSIDFDLNGTYVAPTQVGSDFVYTNFNNSGTDGTMSHYADMGTAYEGVGDILLRYCWMPECEDVDSTYHVNLLAYSLGCSGSDTTEKEITFLVDHDPIPQATLDGASDTVEVTYGEQICFDIMVDVSFITDTLEVRLNSPNFDLLNNYVPPVTTGGQSYYQNFFGVDTAFVPAITSDQINQSYQGIGEIPFRFCITPDCGEIDELFIINMEANTIGCGGSDTLNKTYYVDIYYAPTPIELDLPDFIEVSYGSEICFELLTNDITSSGYELGLKPVGEGFDYVEAYQPPLQGSGGYYYTDFQGLDTVYIEDYSYNNGEVRGKDTVAIRYCLVPGCEEVILENYELNYTASLYTTCVTVQESKTMNVNVEPPVGEVNPIPNVFTPNGDGDNDYFELSGSNDPCYDVMEIQIFNRWGKKVFESDDSLFKWNGLNKNDGGECAEGTYFVLIKGTYGSTYNGATGERIPIPVEKQYTIQLLR